MKRLLTMAIVLAICLTVGAQVNPVLAGSLLSTEGTPSDPYPAINGSPGATMSNPTISNWIYQTGSGSWSGVWGSPDWVDETPSGDENLKVECAIEQYASTVTTGNEIYFHIGNVFSAMDTDRTAFFNCTFTSNGARYLGIQMPKAIPDADLEKSGANLTGRVFNAMVGITDPVTGIDITGEKFPILLLANWSGPNPSGGYVGPGGGYGPGAGYTDVLWWKIHDGTKPGQYNVTWLVRVEPKYGQHNGDYKFDPTLVVAPTL